MVSIDLDHKAITQLTTEPYPDLIELLTRVVITADLVDQVIAADLLHLLKEKAIRHLQDQLLLLQVAEAEAVAAAVVVVAVQHVVEAEAKVYF